MINRKNTTLITALLAAFSCSMLTACNEGKETNASAEIKQEAGTQAPVSMSREVATVNTQTLTEADLAAFLLQGADRAIATDRAINKALASELGMQEFPKETKAAIDAAQRDVAAQVYLSQKAEQLAKTITDDEVKNRYETLVKDADFNGYKIRLGVFPNQQEAVAAREKAAKGEREDKKFQPVGNNGGFVGRGDLPYDLGKVVASLKVGEYSQPITTRNGIFVLVVDEIKQNERPKLDAVKDQIKAGLVQERVNTALTKARETATITIK